MLDTKLYVFCGSDANGRLRSIESLELSKENARWCLLEAEALYSCIYPLLTSIEDKKIIVVGGKQIADKKASVVVLHTESKIAGLASENCGLKLNCPSGIVRRTATNFFVSLVLDSNNSVHCIKYRPENNTVVSLKEFGSR